MKPEQDSFKSEIASADEPASTGEAATDENDVTANEAGDGETAAEDGIAEELVGVWADPKTPRVRLTISYDGTKFYAVIVWSNSAFQYVEWHMTGTYLDGQLISNDCRQTVVTYLDEDSSEEEIMYENGESVFTYMNGKLTWFDAQENSGDGLEFEKQ